MMMTFWVLAPCTLVGRYERSNRHFSPEGGHGTFLLNVGISQRVYTVPKPRRTVKWRRQVSVRQKVQVNWAVCWVAWSNWGGPTGNGDLARQLLNQSNVISDSRIETGVLLCETEIGLTPHEVLFSQFEFLQKRENPQDRGENRCDWHWKCTILGKPECAFGGIQVYDTFQKAGQQ
jgi:hypothetical protein